MRKPDDLPMSVVRWMMIASALIDMEEMVNKVQRIMAVMNTRPLMRRMIMAAYPWLVEPTAETSAESPLASSTSASITLMPSKNVCWRNAAMSYRSSS